MSRFFLFIGVAGIISSCQHTHWLRVCDSGDPEFTECCYVNSKGDTVKNSCEFKHLYSDTLEKIGLVYDSLSNQILAIDRRGDVVFNVYRLEIGPDRISNNLFRILANNKVGFGNLKGKTVIEPQYGWCDSFNEGLAVCCQNCIEVSGSEGHSYMQGGTWFYINKRNKQVLGSYDHATSFFNGQAVIQKEGIKYWINHQGEIIKKYK